MIRQPRAVMRPVELGHAFQVWSRFSPERWHRPDADIAGARSVPLANPICDERAIGREAQSADRWVDKFRRAPAGQVVELARTDLCNPNVHLPVPVRQERYKMTVA